MSGRPRETRAGALNDVGQGSEVEARRRARRGHPAAGAEHARGIPIVVCRAHLRVPVRAGLRDRRDRVEREGPRSTLCKLRSSSAHAIVQRSQCLPQLRRATVAVADRQSRPHAANIPEKETCVNEHRVRLSWRRAQTPLRSPPARRPGAERAADSGMPSAIARVHREVADRGAARARMPPDPGELHFAMGRWHRGVFVCGEEALGLLWRPQPTSSGGIGSVQ